MRKSGSTRYRKSLEEIYLDIYTGVSEISGGTAKILGER